jgi:phosphoglycerate kinase
MELSQEQVRSWCLELLRPAPAFPPLEECVTAIPTLDALADLPAGTRVLVRGDTNVALDAAGRVIDDARLVSLLETLRFGLERGWVWLLHGHLGTDTHPSLRPVADHLGRLLRQHGLGRGPVVLVEDWMEDATGAVRDGAAEVVGRLGPGSVAVLENARRHALERCLWHAGPDDLPALAPRLTRYATDVRRKLARVHVNEGFAASNRDLSSTLVPLAMDRVALGRHVAAELRRLTGRVRRAELVVFSGAKIRKLDDLEGILKRGRVRLVMVAGALALAFRKADANRAGRPFEMGLAAYPERAHGESYVPPGRIEQAARMLEESRDRGVEFVLPVDFRLADGTVAETIPPDGTQLDVGPQTTALQAARLQDFLAFHRRKMATEQEPAIAFHNGVFGVFEREEFAGGTRRHLQHLRRLHEAGVEVYVGGGEGGTALHRYGDPSWVTHCFTAGGTILKALGTEPIPYVKALRLAVARAGDRAPPLSPPPA